MGLLNNAMELLTIIRDGEVIVDREVEVRLESLRTSPRFKPFGVSGVTYITDKRGCTTGCDITFSKGVVLRVPVSDIYDNELIVNDTMLGKFVRNGGFST